MSETPPARGAGAGNLRARAGPGRQGRARRERPRWSGKAAGVGRGAAGSEKRQQMQQANCLVVENWVCVPVQTGSWSQGKLQRPTTMEWAALL